jgi:hypothetical protein
MVLMPSTFVVRGRATRAGHLAFDAVDAAGRPVVADGAVTVAEP